MPQTDLSCTTLNTESVFWLGGSYHTKRSHTCQERIEKCLISTHIGHWLGSDILSGGMCVGSISGISIRSLHVYSKRYAILVCDSSVVDSCPGSVRSGSVLANVAITDDQLKCVLFTTPLFGQNQGNICEKSRKGPAANRTLPLVGSRMFTVCFIFFLPLLTPAILLIVFSRFRKSQVRWKSQISWFVCNFCFVSLLTCYYAIPVRSPKSSQRPENDLAAVNRFKKLAHWWYLSQCQSSYNDPCHHSEMMTTTKIWLSFCENGHQYVHSIPFSPGFLFCPLFW